MDWKLELVTVPVSDVDRAKAFYVEQAGFVADHDHVVTDELRFVQLTPPGSACSIAIGTGITESAPRRKPILVADRLASAVSPNRHRISIRSALAMRSNFSKERSLPCCLLSGWPL